MVFLRVFPFSPHLLIGKNYEYHFDIYILFKFHASSDSPSECSTSSRPMLHVIYISDTITIKLTKQFQTSVFLKVSLCVVSLGVYNL